MKMMPKSKLFRVVAGLISTALLLFIITVPMAVPALAGTKNVNSVSIGTLSGPFTYGTGGTVTATISVVWPSGASGSVATLSMAATPALPAGVTGSFSGTIAEPNTTATLTLTYSSTTFATPGSYNFAVVATVITGVTSPNSSVTVNTRPVTLTGSKSYDGNTTIQGTALTVSNKVGSDTVTLTGSGTLSSSAVGSGRTITSLGTLALAGAQAANYTLTGYSSSVTINQLAVSLTGSKTYDGAATISGTSLSVSNKVGTEDVTLTGSGTLSSSAAGSGHTITGLGTLALAGAQAGNYTLTGYSSSVTISALAVSLTGSKTYDGNTTIQGSALTVSNKVGSDTVTLTGSGTLSSSAVGSSRTITGLGTLALTGAQATDYTLTGYTSSVTINQAGTTIGTVSSGSNPSNQGTGVTFTAGGLPSDAIGTVQFKDAGSDIGAAQSVSGGSASLSNYSGLLSGLHSITATYGGDTNYTGSSSATALTQRVTGLISRDQAVYNSSDHTVDVTGSNYANHSFYITYYDAADVRVHYSSYAVTTGTISGTGATLDLTHIKRDDNTDVVLGTGWHVRIFETASGIPDYQYPVSGSANLIAESSPFEVQFSAMPEFPTIGIGILAVVVCCGIYVWLRRRKLAKA